MPFYASDEDIFQSHVALVRRTGEATTMPFETAVNYLCEVDDIDGKPGIVSTSIAVSTEFALRPASSLIWIGDVDWRISEPRYGQCSGQYFLDEDDARLYLAISDYADESAPVLARTPAEFVERLLHRIDLPLSHHLKELEDRSRPALMSFAQNYVDRAIQAAVSKAAHIVTDGGDLLAHEVDVPFYRVTKQDGQEVDRARCDVEVRRPANTDDGDWSDSLCFEPWEADIAFMVMSAYGESRFKPSELDDMVPYASRLSVINRLQTKSLLPLQLKKVARELRAFPEAGDSIENLTSTIYAAASKNEWSSSDLDEALARLDEIWHDNQRLRQFTMDRGWDAPISPFTVLAARVEAFPWRTTTAKAETPHVVAPDGL